MPPPPIGLHGAFFSGQEVGITSVRRMVVNARRRVGVRTKGTRHMPAHSSPRLKVISGLGQKQTEPLTSRDAVARLLAQTGAALLLKHVSPERAETINDLVDEVLLLFERVETEPMFIKVLERKLNELESLAEAPKRTRLRYLK
jgi:hypothetical protein